MNASQIGERANRLLYAAGFVLFAIQGVILHSLALDVPHCDELEMLRPGGLDRELDLGWIFGYHNEHRIVTTKALIWLLYRAWGWNHVTLVTIGFLTYVAAVYVFHRRLEAHLRRPLGATFVLFATTLAWENQVWGFQIQVHFCVLFFALAFDAAMRRTAGAWLAPLWALLCAYSFGTGLVFAAAVGVLSLVLAFLRKELRRRHFSIALVTFAGLGLWFVGHHGQEVQAAKTVPWTLEFWRYFSEITSLGFGFTGPGVAPGAAVLAGLLLLVLWLLRGLRRASAEEWERWLPALTVIVGVMAALAMISVARASIGQPKATRYAELGLLLVPVAWALFQEAVALLAVRVRVPLLVGAAIGLAVPFFAHFDWSRIYAAWASGHQEGFECIRAYYAGRGDGFCPTLHPTNQARHFDRARELNLSFARHALRKAAGAGAGARKDPAYLVGDCHLERVAGTTVSVGSKVTLSQAEVSRELIGWMIARPAAALSIELVGKAGARSAFGARREPRPDVQKYFGLPAAAAAGVRAELPRRPYENGTYRIHFVASTGRWRVTCDTGVDIDVARPL